MDIKRKRMDMTTRIPRLWLTYLGFGWSFILSYDALFVDTCHRKNAGTPGVVPLIINPI